MASGFKVCYFNKMTRHSNEPNTPFFLLLVLTLKVTNNYERIVLFSEFWQITSNVKHTKMFVFINFYVNAKKEKKFIDVYKVY